MAAQITPNIHHVRRLLAGDGLVSIVETGASFIKLIVH
ncbi:hypothetical protein CES85_4205 [Ochrobactrum quorumnocens]|uniref:Uncharacterized protein n=1 Tax=Ochrobactrum quorumnocens TaxID=271865 RepID=A0A248U9L3_9HYPH|nr:hypothetical protein CES85_4205 [[Ochrobactrum] quorumnocens]